MIDPPSGRGMMDTRKKWAQRIKEWERSGLTRAQFTAGKDFHPASLSYWKWRLLREERDAAKRAVHAPRCGGIGGGGRGI